MALTNKWVILPKAVIPAVPKAVILGRAGPWLAELLKLPKQLQHLLLPRHLQQPKAGPVLAAL